MIHSILIKIIRGGKVCYLQSMRYSGIISRSHLFFNQKHMKNKMVLVFLLGVVVGAFSFAVLDGGKSESVEGNVRRTQVQTSVRPVAVPTTVRVPVATAPRPAGAPSAQMNSASQNSRQTPINGNSFGYDVNGDGVIDENDVFAGYTGDQDGDGDIDQDDRRECRLDCLDSYNSTNGAETQSTCLQNCEVPPVQ